MSTPDDKFAAASPRKATILQTIGAVAWSFFGVRSQRDVDSSELDPPVVVGVAVVAAFVLALLLIIVARLVVHRS
jgi:hypothetical protein